jgi:hypothetical protein
LISFPHLLSASVNPAARRAACGEAVAVMTAGEKARKQIEAPLPPAFSARKSRPQNGTPINHMALPDSACRQGIKNPKDTMQRRPRFETLRAAHITFFR